MTLAEYSHTSIRTLIDAVSQEARNAERDASPDGIHDLRVAIRKLSEILRVFQDLFPNGAAKSVRKDLRIAMKLAGAARNHDIARELLTKAEIPPPPDMTEKRADAATQLSEVLRGWNQAHAARAWRGRLRV